MANNRSAGTWKIAETLKKIAVSVIVVGTFTAYAIHDRLVGSDALASQLPEDQPNNNQAKLSLSVAQSATTAPSPSPFSAVGFPTSTPVSPAELALSGATDAATDAATSADVPTATDVPPTATDLPTATNIPPTATDVPPTATDVPPTATDVPPTAVPKSGYKDGTYTGPVTDAYYGNVQVEVLIQGGKITQIKFLDYPHDRRTSQQINSYAMPRLQQEVIQAQNLNVNIVSGATLTSEAFGQSMQAALAQAQN